MSPKKLSTVKWILLVSLITCFALSGNWLVNPELILAQHQGQDEECPPDCECLEIPPEEAPPHLQLCPEHPDCAWGHCYRERDPEERVFEQVEGTNYPGNAMEKRVYKWKLIPLIDYTYWCVPTSEAMVLAYYDNYVQGAGGFTGYGRLVDYWFDHPDGGNAPSLIDVAIDPKTKTWRKRGDGSSWPSAKAWMLDNFGYDFSFQNLQCNKSNDYCWNEIRAEIDGGRPLMFSVPGHCVAAFGYRVTAAGKKQVIVYDPPNKHTPTYLNYYDHDQCEGIQKIMPGAGGDQNEDNLAIFSPDGGETLNQFSPYQITWFVWGNGIKSIDLDHSTDGGRTWTSIANGIGTKLGYNSRLWTPPTPTNKGRIRIKGYSQYKAKYIAGDGSQNNFIVAATPGGPSNWCSCSWQEVGGYKSHGDRGDWCPPGSFLTQLDLDAMSRARGADSPVVGRARCCKLCAFKVNDWGSCLWREIGYDKSHFQLGDWCPPGSFLTQLDLDGDTSHGEGNGPVVGRAKCCRLPGWQYGKWGTSYWREVGLQMSHGDRGDWCPPGSFLTQLDLDGIGAASVHDSPVVGRCKCTKPAK